MSQRKRQGRLSFGLGVLARAARDPNIGIRFAVSFLLRDVIWESLPIRLRRYWFLVIIAVGLYLCEAVIVLCVLARPDLLPGAREWHLPERLGFGQLAIEALALALAILGALIAFGQIQRALERPRLRLTFEGSSTSGTFSVRTLAGKEWERWIKIQLWNLSDVMAQHIRVRLWFESLGPFEVWIGESHEHEEHWRSREDLPSTQWVWDPGPTFMLHGHEVELIGSMWLRLPAIAYEDVNLDEDVSKRLAGPQTVYIRAFLLDASGRRQQGLFLEFRPWQRPYPEAT